VSAVELHYYYQAFVQFILSLLKDHSLQPFILLSSLL